jgi:hypothetical protein
LAEFADPIRLLLLPFTTTSLSVGIPAAWEANGVHREILTISGRKIDEGIKLVARNLNTMA